MPARKKTASPKDASTATIGFGAKLWLAADILKLEQETEGLLQEITKGTAKP